MVERGGRGDRGLTGPRGRRGPTNRLAVVGYLLLTVAVAAAFWATWNNDRRFDEERDAHIARLNKVNEAQCASLQNLYAVIRKTLADADKAIDEIAYYRRFPTERRRAHARNAATLERFRTPPCPRNISLSSD